MIKVMPKGSVIYDLAAIQGGNTAFTKADEITEKNGVKIMGESNILNKLPVSASSLYAKNMFNFVENLFDKDSTQKNQVYNGLESRTYKTIRAVKSTRSLVLTYKNKLINALFIAAQEE